MAKIGIGSWAGKINVRLARGEVKFNISEGENGEQSRFQPRIPEKRVWDKIQQRWAPAEPGERETNDG